MDRPENRYPQEQAMCARERAAQLLRNRAKEMHAKAVGLDALADWACSLSDTQDEALWRLLCER
jgi:hypothetical protein